MSFVVIDSAGSAAWTGVIFGVRNGALVPLIFLYKETTIMVLHPLKVWVLKSWHLPLREDRPKPWIRQKNQKYIMRTLLHTIRFV